MLLLDCMQKSILFIDDSIAVLKVLQIQIEDSGLNHEFHVEYISKPTQTIDLIQELTAIGIEKIVIVLDFEMPELNGAELIKIIKKEYPNIKFIMLSGQASETLVEELFESKSLDAYFSKPWDVNQLFTQIKLSLS